jgi:glycosyltransferase involved in cell wall biosynthesis
MIVGFDATTLRGRISGVGYYTARLMESLANGAGRGTLDQLVILSNREVDLPAGSAAGAPVVVYPRGRFRVRSVWMQLLLPRILREVRPDLVHFTNYLAPLAAGVPYVVSIHDMSLSLLPECHTLKKRLLTSSLVPFVARQARMILTPSESTRRDVVRLLGVDPGRTRVVPYAASATFRRVEDGVARLEATYGIRRPYFLYVGTLEPRKNLRRALRAFARVAPSLPDHRFVLAGQRGWKYAEVLREAQRPELAGRVHFLGYLPEDDLPALYSHAEAFVYPSLYEGFGLPVVEAMACGTPVLTSRSSSLTEVASGAAFLVDPVDESALADALHALGSDSSLRCDLSSRGRSRAAAYSWERTGRETVAVYGEVYDEVRARRRPAPRAPSPRR